MSKKEIELGLLYIVLTVLFLIGNAVVCPLYLLWRIRDFIWRVLGWTYEPGQSQ